MDPGSSHPWQEAGNGITNYAAGLYHTPSGSRLFYGIPGEWGLPARVRNPWIRALPLAENHKPSMADLKTTVSVTGEPETYLYLGSPRLDFFRQNPARRISLRGYSSAQIDQDINPEFGGGLEARLGEKTEVRLDSLYAGKVLPPRESASWFSGTPPLPEREFRFYALGMLINAPILTLSSDWACSEAFAWGRDLYGNLGLRAACPKPGAWGRWALSLAADGAGSRYLGRDGSSPGAGFRTGGKFEWHGKGSGLFRLSTTLRSPGFEEPFNRTSSSLSCRFPISGRNTAGGFRVTRISLGADRNASEPDKTLDSLSLTAGFSLNPRSLSGPEPGAGKSRGVFNSPVGISLTGSLKGITAAEKSPYPFPQNPYQFNSAKTTGELIWSPGFFQFRAKLGYDIKTEKEGIWDTSFSTAVRFKPGRFSVKISSPNFPEEWAYTITWRVEKK
jgi:hypothetical protein